MGVLTRLAVRIGRIEWLPRYLPQIVRVDELLQRVSRGRVTLLDLAGLPNLVLTVPGRRTGVPRSTPLLCVPYGDAYLVAGSYFGDEREPQWVANLAAAEAATIQVQGRELAVDAVEQVGERRAEVWPQMLAIWPNFARYEQRTTRPIRVFELIPAAAPPRG